MNQAERIVKLDANIEWPEIWPWYIHDKESVYKIAKAICTAINEDYKTRERNFVPGLKLALRLLENLYPFEVD